MEFVEIPVYIARGIKNNDINLYDYVCDILNEANKIVLQMLKYYEIKFLNIR